MADEQQLEKTSELSIQARGRGEVTGMPVVIPWLTIAGQLISPWWSQSRDKQLRTFWKKIDHLAGTIYTFQSRISTIPLHVEPRDFSIRAHMRQADQFTEMLLEDTEFGAGWNSMIEPGIEDFLSQDNGIMLEVIGDGEPDGPIQGPVQMVNHLDAAQCRRTASPEFPITYMDPDDGKIYKLHRSRVIFAAQMPSASTRMNGVGLCAVSRCINISQNIYDILVYKQEKLGSRPPRGVWITKGKLTPSVVESAFLQAAETMNNQRLSRFSKIVVMGSADAPDAEIQELDLASLPDGFDEKTSITLGMAAISLAFGVDARELFPGLSAGATKAEALVSHLKQRGKGYGQTLQILTRQFNQKVLPPHLKLVFDYQDDAEDMQVAEIRKTRADTRVKNLMESGITDTRTERENMLRDGDITQAQFERMELEDGRLEDGSDVLTLFTNKAFRTVLDLGLDNPFDVVENDKQETLDLIEEKRAFLLSLYGEAASVRIRKEIDQARAALDALEELYEEAKPEPKPKPAQTTEGGETIPTAKPDQGLIVDGDDLEIENEKGLRVLDKEFGKIRRKFLSMAKDKKDRKSERALAVLERAVKAAEEVATIPIPIEVNVSDIIPEVVINVPEQKEADIHVHVPESPAPIVNVESPGIPAPIVNVEIPEQKEAVINVQVPEKKEADIHIHVPEAPAPVVNIEIPEQQVNVTIDMPDIEEETETEVKRDAMGRIAKTISRITKRVIGR